MNHIYIGDRQLDPDDEPEVCEICGGQGQYQDFVGVNGDWDVFDCPNCPPDMSDPGEPNEDPE